MAKPGLRRQRPSRPIVDGLLNALHTAARVAAIVVAVAFVAALAVYTYAAFPVLMWAWVMVLTALYGLSLYLVFMVFSKDGRFLAALFVGAWAVAWVVNGFVLAMASAWNVQLGEPTRGILGFPHAVLSAVVQFLVAFVTAIPGVHLVINPVAPEPLTKPVYLGEIDVGPALHWVAASIWEIIIGIIGGLLTAVVLEARSRRQS